MERRNHEKAKIYYSLKEFDLQWLLCACAYSGCIPQKQVVDKFHDVNQSIIALNCNVKKVVSWPLIGYKLETFDLC